MEMWNLTALSQDDTQVASPNPSDPHLNDDYRVRCKWREFTTSSRGYI